jgi:6,7-dimethyl-8-ribityllumazine synthase
MPRVHKGSREAKGLRFAVVVSRFNSAVTSMLLSGALKALAENGAADADVEVVHVPGAFELPLFVHRLASCGKFNAIIALGAVVRGETEHHHYLNQSVFEALQNIALSNQTPISLGVLTTDNMEQALRRAGDDPGNKGHEAAMTAIETANLVRELG